VAREISITLDQFFRPQPGGVATYARGLLRGLASLDDGSLHLTGIAPRGRPRQPIDDLAVHKVSAMLPVEILTRAWAHFATGVPESSDVVHATSLAGPYRGGQAGAVHSVAVHDLLWRDEPTASTPRGIRFHEKRLQLLRRRGDVRVITTAPGLRQRLLDDDFVAERLFEARFGVDDDDVVASSRAELRSVLATHGVEGGFTLYAGTREPRKNLERLISAHARARLRNDELGPLVLVGPSGWGQIEVGSAVVMGVVRREILKALLRDATVVAYVPLAEGYGLPPVEALHQGARVVASRTTPSVAHNAEVVVVDPLDDRSIEEGLLAGAALTIDDAARAARRASVADLTWRNVALDHLASWQ
jgi:glycosyltransferase involved in cell wall biosynthesis